MTERLEAELEREEFTPEETATLEDFLETLRERLRLPKGATDLSDAQREVAERVYERRFSLEHSLEAYGIYSFERVYTFRGVKFVETRYAIKGLPGSWGMLSAYAVAIDRAMAAGDEEAVARFTEFYERLLRSPIRTIRRYRD